MGDLHEELGSDTMWKLEKRYPFLGFRFCVK
jgi:hypothetical protein